jgi:hypothetical protein
MKTKAFIPLAFAAVAMLAVVVLGRADNPGVINREVRIRGEVPVVNVPHGLRQGNWLGPQREGSCVHATLVSLLRWQGQDKLASFWRSRYSDGEWPSDMQQKLDATGVRYAWHIGGDERFLEWACRTRRGAGIRVHGGAHMVALVHLNEKWAGILDNNDTSKFKWISRESLLRDWKGCNGWAFSPVYSPAAPLPPTPFRREKK